jgi:hypothetical protein
VSASARSGRPGPHPERSRSDLWPRLDSGAPEAGPEGRRGQRKESLASVAGIHPGSLDGLERLRDESAKRPTGQMKLPNHMNDSSFELTSGIMAHAETGRSHPAWLWRAAPERLPLGRTTAQRVHPSIGRSPLSPITRRRSKVGPLLPARQPGPRRPSLGRHRVRPRAVGRRPGAASPLRSRVIAAPGFADGAGWKPCHGVGVDHLKRRGGRRQRTIRKRGFGSGACGVRSGSTRRDPGF